MPLYKIIGSMSLNGIDKPLECVIHEVNDEEVFVTLKGGPFNGERFLRYDLTNLIYELSDLRTSMQEVKDGTYKP